MVISLTTPELEDLARKYEFPKGLRDILILKGIRAEIEFRKIEAGGGSNAKRCADVSSALTSAYQKIDGLARDIKKLETENAELRASKQ